jgi:hypothetical protein
MRTDGRTDMTKPPSGRFSQICKGAYQQRRAKRKLLGGLQKQRKLLGGLQKQRPANRLNAHFTHFRPLLEIGILQLENGQLY